jgi:hypothetical protein
MCNRFYRIGRFYYAVTNPFLPLSFYIEPEVPFPPPFPTLCYSTPYFTAGFKEGCDEGSTSISNPAKMYAIDIKGDSNRHTR